MRPRINKGLVDHFDQEVSHTYPNSYQYPNSNFKKMTINCYSTVDICYDTLCL